MQILLNASLETVVIGFVVMIALDFVLFVCDSLSASSRQAEDMARYEQFKQMDELLQECYIKEEEFFADFYDGEEVAPVVDMFAIIIGLQTYKLHGHSVVLVSDLPQAVMGLIADIKRYKLRGQEVVRLNALERLA